MADTELGELQQNAHRSSIKLCKSNGIGASIFSLLILGDFPIKTLSELRVENSPKNNISIRTIFQIWQR